MTREEAIKELCDWLEQMIQNGVPSHSAKRKALAYAISALSDMPINFGRCWDCISFIAEGEKCKWGLLTAEDGYCHHFCEKYGNNITESPNDAVEKNDEVIEPSDLISRAEVKKLATKFFGNWVVFENRIDNLPSVSVESKDCWNCDKVNLAYKSGKADADNGRTDCTDFLCWLLEEIMDEENWELNAEADGEIIARKLKKLGLLDSKDGYYIRTPMYEALTEPSDLISRAEAKKQIYLLGKRPQISDIWDCLDNIPSICFQEENGYSTKTTDMVELISKESVKKIINRHSHRFNSLTYDSIIDYIDKLPSADRPKSNYITESPNDVDETDDEVIDRPIIEHDREWIIGCIKHDGFLHTDRFDKANQIILDALADRPSGEWVRKVKEYNDCDGYRAYYWYECSECGAKPPKDQWKNEWHSPYCPNCGAKMKGADNV